MRDFRCGQLWTSEAEPDLGLGLVVAVEDRHVEIDFDAVPARRRYARATAPLARALFQPGDDLLARSGAHILVHAVEECDGLRVYVGEQRIAETDLAPLQGAGGPLERLRRGLVDPLALFDLRQEAFAHLHRLGCSPLRGFAGARIRLLPHQLSIASAVARRDPPRVLLADEVGLGKTIEAGLVLARLLLSGRIERVLVVTPEHLVHQWFLELLRRFQLRFALFDEERCASIEAEGTGNPFLDEQLVLCSLPLLAGPRGRGAQVVAAGWDLLVVDEVHHLDGRPGAPGPGYSTVAALSVRASGVILLSGTPLRLGEEAHFARLHLLDPLRHADFAAHRAETARWQETACRLAEAAAAAAVFPDDGSLVIESVDREAEAETIDRDGPGRAIFRNTRASVGGFPRRVARPAPLEAAPGAADCLEAIAREVAQGGTAAEFPADEGAEPWVPDYAADPRIPWLAGLLRRTAPRKVLVLAGTTAQVAAIAAALEREIAVKRALFHDGLTLLQRDRNAAWFAEDDGARVLLCSEIGGEGRNFQFAHDLVLFDLPVDPELLEQRIGRLDRIGQERDVEIHLPHVVGSAHEVVYRWYAEALDAFARPVPDGNALRERFAGRLVELATTRHLAHAATRKAHELAVAELLRESRAFSAELAAQHAAGRDRLLERASFRRAEAAELAGAIALQDADPALRDFLGRAFDQAGVEVEDLGPGTTRLGAERLFVDAFPSLPPEGLTVTFEREVACRREEVEFLTWDHPMATGALEQLVASTSGTLAVATFDGEPGGDVLAEAFFAIETAAPRTLDPGRYLPTTPLRVVVDGDLRDRTAAFAPESRRLGGLPEVAALALLARVRGDALAMVAAARGIAGGLVEATVARALAAVRADFAAERARANELAVGYPAGVNALARRLRELDEREQALLVHLGAARSRLDALRILLPRPGEAGTGGG